MVKVTLSDAFAMVQALDDDFGSSAAMGFPDWPEGGPEWTFVTSDRGTFTLDPPCSTTAPDKLDRPSSVGAETAEEATPVWEVPL